MNELLGGRRLAELLERHEVRPKKSLGQNFVIDPNTIRKVIAIAGLSPEAHVLEIGPGAGSLTLALAQAAARVTAVEIDARLIPVLHEVLQGLDGVDIVQGDAMLMDPGSFGASHLVGNLPYNIAVPIVMHVLQQAPSIQELTVMTQSEVGERLAASPGSKVYGQASVMTQFYGATSVAARVSRRAFHPIPNVDSVLVRISRRSAPLPVDPVAMSTVVRGAFSQRRKTMRNALASALGGIAAAEALIRSAGLDVASRAEEIPLDGFVSLAQAYGGHPASAGPPGRVEDTNLKGSSPDAVR
ncbi:MAG: 16S rRNA (adenine(1518)-N(6)/adenine(1519)-N(6))-dimethyltransferase RsmA [Actinomycetota bacterium]|nr:16S rRNA (adenine(1518)-N(6)/adenine(1519)-N(6))-dimethyltransferase RsmA [Actinomycetota bacterium]